MAVGSEESSRFLFKFKSSMHGLNEELDRHNYIDRRKVRQKSWNVLCGDECENVIVL